MSDSKPQNSDIVKAAAAEAAAAPTTGNDSVKANEQSTSRESKTAEGPAKSGSAVAAPAHHAAGNEPVGARLTPEMAQQVLSGNPSLRAQFQGVDEGKALESLRKLSLNQLLQGTSTGGPQGPKGMDAHKFWSTQPVIRFDDKSKDNTPDGPIKDIKAEEVSKTPKKLPVDFEWSAMDLEDEKQLKEVTDLLSLHYVEDDGANFRLNYSSSFLNYALKSPGWKKDWHVGVRTAATKKLVAFVSAVPCKLHVRGKVIESAEVNFLCVHKKLRDKRLAPVMIAEITRQCYLKGIFQACYTAGVLLPTPVSTCRYYHRSLRWEKLYECRFAGLPPGSTKQRQVLRYKVPEKPQLPGLRAMTKQDVPAVTDLLDRYLRKFMLAPEYSEEEVSHWMVHDPAAKEQVIYSYVVEDPKTKKITDFFSFYLLESTVIGNPHHNNIRAAYFFYYATETAHSGDKEALKKRLNALALDALIMAYKAGFDVMNCLTLLDGPLFLEQQKFQPGDGQLHYYLFNYRTAPVPSGMNEQHKLDESKMGGVGLVML